MSGILLAVNAGSSSIKFAAFDATKWEVRGARLRGRLEGIGQRPRLVANDAAGHEIVDLSYRAGEIADHNDAIGAISAWLRGSPGGNELMAAGHRVAHGGASFSEPTVIDDALLRELQHLVPLAPLHQPANLAGIQALRSRHPLLPQVACFDTAFHRDHSEIADRFALPDLLYREGIRRYGFHGLSYAYIARRLRTLAPGIAAGRVVVAHLGSGASMCAIADGRSVDTTMSFSALDGMPMGTRCGAVDPGVLIYLLREKRMAPDALEMMLYRESGLRGLSSLSGDMRDLLEKDDPRARLAVDYFVYHACRHLAALASTMEGVDAIVFTAGIGEYAPIIRSKICHRLAWLGVTLDDAANAAGGPRITSDASPVSAWVVPTDEESQIADYTVTALRATEREGIR